MKLLDERVQAAKKYFEPLLNKIIATLKDQIKAVRGKTGMKKYTAELRDLEQLAKSRFFRIDRLDLVRNPSQERFVACVASSDACSAA